MSDLGCIRVHRNKATAISLANTLLSSRLDYCYSLLLSCSEKYKTSLQRVQNCLARVVTRSSRLSESRPLFKSQHWLPNKLCIKFKPNLLTYPGIFMGTPSNLKWFIDPEKITAFLRSWLLHCACGINCHLKNVKQNESVSLGKK